MKKRILLIALIGMSFGIRAQIIDNGTLSLRNNSSAVGDILSLFGNRIGQADMYGFGIEISGGVLYNKAVWGHNWYLNRNANNGTSAIMRLNNNGLTVNGGITVQNYSTTVGEYAQLGLFNSTNNASCSTMD